MTFLRAGGQTGTMDLDKGEMPAKSASFLARTMRGLLLPRSDSPTRTGPRTASGWRLPCGSLRSARSALSRQSIWAARRRCRLQLVRAFHRRSSEWLELGARGRSDRKSRTAARGRLLAVSSFGSSCSVADRFVAPCIGPGSARSRRPRPAASRLIERAQPTHSGRSLSPMTSPSIGLWVFRCS